MASEVERGASVAPLSESAWQELESGSARLLPDAKMGRAAGGYIAGLWAAVVAEYRCLHRDLALHTRAPASFPFESTIISRTMRILERSLRPGEESEAGAWRLTREDGRNDDGQPFAQYTISHAAGGGTARQTNLVLIKQTSAPPSSFYPLPFETAVLEESDATGRSVVQAIERDEEDAVFVGAVTLKGEKPTGSPTDFGVLLRQNGTQEWTGGTLARQALVESARLSAQERLATERAALARGSTDVSAAEVHAQKPITSEPAREAPRPASRRPPRRRQAERPTSPGITPEQPVVCSACGAAAPAGAGFCPACGARIETQSPVQTNPPAVAAKCPQCQAALGPSARFCPSCGASASSFQRPSVPEPAPTPARCRKCGANLSRNARFCSSCGETVGAAAPVTRRSACAACGAPLKPDARFCSACGANVGSAGELGAITPSRLPVCASCGAELRAGARFCRRCGAPRP